MKKFYLLLIMNMVYGVLNGMDSEAVPKVDSLYLRAKRESTLLKGLQHWLGQGVEQSSDRALDYLSEVLEDESEETFQLFINVISEHELETKHGLIPLALLAKLGKRFIENGIDGGVKDTLGKLALHFASKSGHRDLWSQEILDFIWINRDIFPEGVVNFVAQEMMKNPGIRAWVLKNIAIPVNTLVGHTNKVLSAVYSPDGKYVVTGSIDKTAKIWDSKAGVLLRTLEGHTGWVTSAVYSPDGKYILTGSRDYGAKIWDSSTGELLHNLYNIVGWLTKGVSPVVYGPDGKHVVTPSFNGTVKIWDSEAGALLRTLEGHASYVSSVVYSPDGKHVLTGSWDYSAKIWDSKTGELLHTLDGHSTEVNSAVYSPDGKHVVTASIDGTVKIWDSGTGEFLRTLEGHRSSVRTVAYSPDGKHVVTVSIDDETVKIWDSKTGELLYTLEGHTDYVNSAVYSPDGKHALTASRDYSAKIWDISLIDFIENELSPKQASLILPLYKEQNTSGLKIMLNRWQKDLQIKKTLE